MLVPVIYLLSLFIIYLFVLVYSLLLFIYFVSLSTIYSLVVCFHFSSILCFVVQKKKNNSHPELVFRYFIPAYHHQFESINIIQQTPPTQYRSEGPITTIDIAGQMKQISPHSQIVAEGETIQSLTVNWAGFYMMLVSSMVGLESCGFFLCTARYLKTNLTKYHSPT